jgi:hypothetical protein
MKTSISPIGLVEDATQELINWAKAITQSDNFHFHQVQKLATRLGAHYRVDGLTEIGFWTPELGAEMEHRVQDVYLEVLTPLKPIDFRAQIQVVPFQRDRLKLKQQGEYFWGVIAGMIPGTKERAGSFYWLRYVDNHNTLHTIPDALAYSLPYGVFAPAELYDINSLQTQRADLDYFAYKQESEAVVKVSTPSNILQLHVQTASQEGTLEGLTRIYHRIAEKLQAQKTLTPAESTYIGYDAVQLLPIVTTAECRVEGQSERDFFTCDRTIEPEAVELEITLKKPDTQNWGYDVVIAGSSATQPAVLGSLRPDELVEFIATLHNFPTGSIQVIYDLVYGHADNQALELLNSRYFKGPNMYGQDVYHQDPTVRAILLEMQRRQINTGVDGIRVDGAQDFKFFNPSTNKVEIDDTYLESMSFIIQEICEYRRQLFAIYEDGRPWPQMDWEAKSTYRSIILKHRDVLQWGPLIFAGNTPTLTKFWDEKWQRVCEVMQFGANWITGCGNHDTVRRGNQVDLQQPINWNLGKTLPEVIHNAYDNPAIMLWIYGFSPGIPMDFLNATMHAPWGFFRNTDDVYGVKVAAEEAGFLDWEIEPELYAQADAFPRLKQLGFDHFDDLCKFMHWLQLAVTETSYDLEKIVFNARQSLDILNSDYLTTLDVEGLQALGKAFMEDCHDIANVSRYETALDPQRTHFNLNLRHYRRLHPWLRENLTWQDSFHRLSDDKSCLYYGVRSDSTLEPDASSEQVAMIAHLGGEPLTIELKEYLELDLSQWRVAIATPGLNLEGKGSLTELKAFEIKDGQGLLLEKISS